MQAKYNHRKTEEKWYSYWLENDYFSSKPESEDPGLNCPELVSDLDFDLTS